MHGATHPIRCLQHLCSVHPTPAAHHRRNGIAPHTWPRLSPCRGATEPPLCLPFPDTCIWGQAVSEDGRGKLAGGGSPRSPHERACCSPPLAVTHAWLWHSSSQAVALERAMSCEAAPRLGITISPATQSREKTSPSSTSVISIEGVGLSVWEWHYVPDRDSLQVQH